MTIAFKAKSRNTFPAFQTFENVLFVDYLEKQKMFEIHYIGSDGKLCPAWVSNSYFVSTVVQNSDSLFNN